MFVFLNSQHFVFAGIINPDNPQEGWKDDRAYRPAPVLFLHGFAQGSPQSWTEAGIEAKLKPYYARYYAGYSADPTILASTRYPYLEIIDFGSSLIDRNSSIDTYKIGDRYVLAGQRKLGDPGWTDKVNNAIEQLRQGYRHKDGSAQKVILVGHSMGGLAARKYLKSYSYANQKIEKLIMIGTPNLGSLLSSATTHYNKNRRWGWYTPISEWSSSFIIGITDKIVELSSSIDTTGDAVWDMDPAFTGSGFISDLNTNFVESIGWFAIAGKHWLGFNKGDVIVSLNSQLGKGTLTLKDKSTINATHWDEPKLSVSGDNPLLKFLDSAKPEMEITSPDPSRTTETYDSSVRIQGKAYKEYLPADTMLTINITKQDDGSKLPEQTRALKPSDLWLPNNPDSPVAEFDETMNLPGSGTYKISCQLKNPAGLTSEAKEVWVKVLALEGTHIIVHAHNPEGKEIASIRGMNEDSVEIYDGDTFIGYGAYNAETHDSPMAISTGNHNIKVKFNGMTLEQNIYLNEGETKVLTFTFTRTEILNTDLFSGTLINSANRSLYYTQVLGGLRLYAEEPPFYVGVEVAFGGGAIITWGVEGSVIITPSAISMLGSANIDIPTDYPWSAKVGDYTISISSPIFKNYSIPSREDFTLWYGQYYAEKNTEHFINLLRPGESRYTQRALMGMWDKGYNLRGFLASYTYDRIRFDYYAYNTINADYTWNPVSLTINLSKTYSYPGSGYKFSSVPYDVMGDAL
ncbi:MAG TPA: alpha/beta hydrolase [Candidatus Omnitrophota bacterium]|nr:alpha/beta hydrolase [Candidatus Omnitrophota bacterium]